MPKLVKNTQNYALCEVWDNIKDASVKTKTLAFRIFIELAQNERNHQLLKRFEEETLAFITNEKDHSLALYEIQFLLYIGNRSRELKFQLKKHITLHKNTNVLFVGECGRMFQGNKYTKPFLVSCAQCKVKEVKACFGGCPCGMVYFCGRSCQKRNWLTHRDICPSKIFILD